MKKKNLTEIVVVLDESGSMDHVKDDTIGGFNNFIKEQREVDGDVNMTLIKFNTKYEVEYLCKNILDVPKLSSNNYSPGSTTALLDAVGRGIYEVSSDIQKRKEENKPNKLLFVIMTDGYENASGEYSYQQIKNLINTKEDEDQWEFLFIGADLQDFGDGLNMGLSNMTNVDKSNMKDAYDSLSTYTTMYRETDMSAQARIDATFNNQEKEEDKE